MSAILVTGGNGFVGRHLVAALLARGDAVRVLALPAEDAGWLERRGVAVHRGDVRDGQTLSAPVAGADAVVHLAGLQDVWAPDREYHAVNVTGTVNVCRAACAADVGRLVHVSSSSVYGAGLGRAAAESFPLRPLRDPYPVTKAAADLAVQAMIAEGVLGAVIIRPDQVFGPGDRLHFGRTADRVAAGRAVVVGSGGNPLPLVYVSDLVQALLLALDRQDAPGPAYNIGNDQPLTQREFLDAVAAGIGARRPRLHLPYRALYGAAYIAERLATRFPATGRPPLTRLGVAFLGTDGRHSIAKARRELGYAPMVGLREGVGRAAAWYLADRAGRAPSVAAEPGHQELV